MKKITYLIIIFLSIVSYGQTQAEMNKDAYESYLNADKTLNLTYNKLLPLLDKEARDLLIKAQKDWIKFRDSHCNFEIKSYEGGSIQPLIYYNCLESKTTERIKDLKASIEDYSR